MKDKPSMSNYRYAAALALARADKAETEIKRLRSIAFGAEEYAQTVRGTTIEECARVVDNFGMDEALSYGLDGIAAAIRALKDKS